MTSNQMNSIIKPSIERVEHAYTPPEALRRHPDYPLWKKPWLATHRKPWMYSIIITGKSGRGKSTLSLALATLLDRSWDNKPRFTLDRVFFDNSDFQGEIQKDHPNGTVHIVDDAGMDLFRRDAMARQVKGAIKVAMTMRYKRPIVIYNLPDLDLLEQSIIKLSDMLITVWGYDQAKKLTKFSVQFIRKYSNNKTIYYPYPIIIRQIETGMGITWNMRVRKKKFLFYMAKKELIDEYKLIKDYHMKRKWKLIRYKVKAGEVKDLNMERIRERLNNRTIVSEKIEKNEPVTLTDRSLDEKTNQFKPSKELMEGWNG